MSKQIWKYELSGNESTDIEIPADAKILTVQIQKGQACIWVLVNPSSIKQKRTIQVFGTGQDISIEPREYIGTYQQLNGSLIWHVFELLNF